MKIPAPAALRPRRQAGARAPAPERRDQEHEGDQEERALDDEPGAEEQEGEQLVGRVGVDELRQQGEEEDRDLGIEDVGQQRLGGRGARGPGSAARSVAAAAPGSPGATRSRAACRSRARRRYAAPAHLTSANAVADAASSAARPNAATSVWTTQPAMTPSAAARPPATPWRSVRVSVEHHVDARRRVDDEDRRREHAERMGAEHRRRSADRRVGASGRAGGQPPRSSRPPAPSPRRRRCRAPRRPSSCRASCSAPSSVTTMRAPLAPIGWPSATAPPWTLTISCAQLELVHRRHRHRGERLVDFPEVDVLGGPAGLLQHLLDRADRRGREPVRRLRVHAVADDARDRLDAERVRASTRASAPARRRRRRCSTRSRR